MKPASPVHVVPQDVGTSCDPVVLIQFQMSLFSGPVISIDVTSMDDYYLDIAPYNTLSLITFKHLVIHNPSESVQSASAYLMQYRRPVILMYIINSRGPGSFLCALNLAEDSFIFFG